MFQRCLLGSSRLVRGLTAMISAPIEGVAHMGKALGGMRLSKVEEDKQVDEARTLLESVVLLETVAVEREAKAESIVESLANEGMGAAEVAERLDIPDAAVQIMLEREQPNPPHARMGVSEETVERLDPCKVRD